MVTFPRFLLKNCWVIIFNLMVWALFLQEIYKKHHLVVKLEEKAQALKQATTLAQEEKKELLLRIHSQEDLEWMELVFKEKLGVVPEGQIKVVFE